MGKWLSAQGHDVHYIVGETKRDDITNIHVLSKNIKVKFNGNYGTMPLPVGKKKINQLLQKEKYDILHVQIPYSPFYAHKIIKQAPKETRIIGTFHIAPNNNLVTVANTLLGIWLKSSLKKFDQFLSVSTTAQKFAKKTFHINSDLSPNVVDIKHFLNATTITTRDDKDFNILFLGTIGSKKRLPGFIKCYQSCNKKWY
jgi:phosphatidylinositol alpha-mannosyltransferase